MISRVNSSSYQSMVRLSRNLSNFMQQAQIARSQISNSLASNVLATRGIGVNIDIKA